MPAPLQEPATIYEITRPLRPLHMSRIIGSVMLASRDPSDLLVKRRPHWEVEYHYSSLSGGVPTGGSLQYVEIHPGECRFPPATQYSNDKENVYIRVYGDGRIAVGRYNEMPDSGIHTLQFGVAKIRLSDYDTSQMLLTEEQVTQEAFSFKKWFEAEHKEVNETRSMFAWRVFEHIEKWGPAWDAVRSSDQ